MDLWEGISISHSGHFDNGSCGEVKWSRQQVWRFARTQVRVLHECVPLHCSPVRIPIGFTGFAKAFPEIWKVLREFDHVEMRAVIQGRGEHRMGWTDPISCSNQHIKFQLSSGLPTLWKLYCYVLSLSLLPQPRSLDLKSCSVWNIKWHCFVAYILPFSRVDHTRLPQFFWSYNQQFSLPPVQRYCPLGRSRVIGLRGMKSVPQDIIHSYESRTSPMTHGHYIPLLAAFSAAVWNKINRSALIQHQLVDTSSFSAVISLPQTVIAYSSRRLHYNSSTHYLRRKSLGFF